MNKKSVLFIMPFGDKSYSIKNDEGKLKNIKINFDKKYREYKKKLEEFDDIDVYRVDDSMISKIDYKMFQMIDQADIVFADITMNNPNVMYELGVRHTRKDKITILFKMEKLQGEIPFDIKNITVHKDDIFKDDKKLRNILDGKSTISGDSPVFDVLNKNKFELIFEKKSTNWQNFKDKYDKYYKLKEYGEIEKLVSKYIKDLSGIEEFDQKHALSIYKNNKSKDALKDALKIIERYNPFNSNEYETIGLYASITKKMYEQDFVPSTKNVAMRIAYYFLSKFRDAYSISSYYMIKLALCEKGEITFAELKYEFKNLAKIFEQIEESQDDYLGDTKKIIDFAISESAHKEPKFDHEESAKPVYFRLKKLKDKNN